MSADVCFAARMPASRAVCSGSPFLTAPRRIWRSASRDMVIVPRATASRFVIALSPTSTIFTRPRASTCDSVTAAPGRPAAPAPALPDLPALFFMFALRQEKREALERDGQVDAFELHAGRHFERARGEVQHRLDAGGDDEIEHLLRGGGRHRDDGDADALALRDLLQIVDVVDRHTVLRLLPDLFFHRVEQRGDLEAFLPEAGIVGQRETEIA